MIEVLVRTHGVHQVCSTARNSLAESLPDYTKQLVAGTDAQQEAQPDDKEAMPGFSASSAQQPVSKAEDGAMDGAGARDEGNCSASRPKRRRSEHAQFGLITSGSMSSLMTKPYSDMRGHTGFLLFCSKRV